MRKATAIITFFASLTALFYFGLSLAIADKMWNVIGNLGACLIFLTLATRAKKWADKEFKILQNE